MMREVYVVNTIRIDQLDERIIENHDQVYQKLNQITK